MKLSEFDKQRHNPHIDILSVDPDSLADINNVQINKHLPREKRIAEFLWQIKNPYCFRCGKVVVNTNSKLKH